MQGEDRGYGPERYPHSELTGRIIGAAQRVHRELGPGYREVFYQRALALELPAHDLECERELRIPVHYRGKQIGRQRVDFAVNEVLVEVKAKAEMEEPHVGSVKELQVKRLIHSARGRNC